jgi:hypothetical protein
MAAPSLAAISAVAKPMPDVPPRRTILLPLNVMLSAVCVSIEAPSFACFFMCFAEPFLVREKCIMKEFPGTGEHLSWE